MLYAVEKRQVFVQRGVGIVSLAEILDHDPAVIADAVQRGEERGKIDHPILERRPTRLPDAAGAGVVTRRAAVKLPELIGEELTRMS